MKHRMILFVSALVLAMVACNAMGHAPPWNAGNTEAQQVRRQRPSPAPSICRIHTGFADGRVNLRTCGGTSCAVVQILREGENLIQTSPAVNGWIPVRKPNGLRGWVNARYCKGE